MSPRHAQSQPAFPLLVVGLFGTSVVCLTLLLSQTRFQLSNITYSTGGDDRAGSHAAQGGAAPLSVATVRQTCPDVAAAAAAPSQWSDSCVRLERACVDQGTIIGYGKEPQDKVSSSSSDGSSSNSGSSGKAYLIEPDEDRRKWDGATAPLPIRVRRPSIVSGNEGAAYLRRPIFSSCTVPVVWYSMWPHNFAHAFRDNAAKIYGFLRNTPWARHLKLALVTADGLAAPDMNLQIFQPMLDLQVETWADFSTRLPARQTADGSGYLPAGWSEAGDGGADTGGPPLSWEGGPQRCFEQLFVCNRGLNITTWPLHGLGQHLAQHSQQQLSAGATSPKQQPSSAGAASPHQQLLSAGAASLEHQPQGSWRQRQQAKEATPEEVGRPRSGDSGERVLRVVFHKRSSPDRQLLNAAELVERCNSWRHTTATGERLRAVCWEEEMDGLFAGLAAAQQADVFVAMHGANQANGWLMRPGSAMIELQPFGFDHGPAHLQYPLFNMEDAETQVQWWLVSACDPAASTPGVHEQRGLANERVWAKNRNMQIGWQPLAEVLQVAVEAAGDMAEYRRRWQEGRWWWWLGPGGRLEQVGVSNLSFTKMRCPAHLTSA